MRSLRFATFTAAAVFVLCIWSVRTWNPRPVPPQMRVRWPDRGRILHSEPLRNNELADPLLLFAESSSPYIAAFQPVVAEKYFGESVLSRPQPTLGTELPMRLSARRPHIAALPTVDLAGRPTFEKQGKILLPPGDQGDRWPYPDALAARLGSLFENPATSDWADAVLERLDELSQTRMKDRTETAYFLVELEDLMQKNLTLQQMTTDEKVLRELRQAHYGISRRLAIWKKTHRAINREHLVSVRERRMLPSELDARLAGSLQKTKSKLGTQGKTWADYLKLSDIETLLNEKSAAKRNELARKVLERLESKQLDRAQQKYLHGQPFRDLNQSLRHWVTSTVDYSLLIEAIERFEESPMAPMAGRVAKAYNELKWAGDPALQKMASAINTHYRNANVRVSLSTDFINRLLPSEENVHEPVNDSVLGAQVNGTSLRSSNVRVRFYPDGGRWRIGLEASGSISSRTSSRRGPARFFNRGYSEFFAQKLVLVDPMGIWIDRAEASADTATELTNMETDFDSFPVLNLLVRSYVRQQYDIQEADARSVVRGRVAGLAQHRLDTEVQARVDELKQNFHKRTLAPVVKLGLKPTALHMETTDRRLIARYRLAGTHQLGAYSPRPMAPGNSVMSAQVHESSLNNTFESLNIAGRKISLVDLYREVSEKLGSSDLTVPEDIPQGVTVIMAQEEPVSVRCHDGFVALQLRVKELSDGKRKWRNFIVHAKYVPHTNQLRANLRREDTIQLEGRRLRFRDRIALQGIFTKALSRTKSFDLVNRKLRSNPRLADLQVVQFTIRGGWISVALGPKATALVARRPSPYN